MTTDHTDVVVLGAGSAGERTAAELAKRGRAVTVVERRLVGGECPFFACIPSKAMLSSAAARAVVASADRIGATSGPMPLQSGAEAFLRAVRRRDEAAAHHDDADHVKSLRDAGVDLVRGVGRVLEPGRMAVETGDGDVELTFDDLVVATGSSPVVPDIPGLADADPWTFEEAWTAHHRPMSMLVLGAGPVGCEIAQAYARFGTGVTLVDATALLGGGEEPEAVADLRRVLEDDHVAVHEGVEVSGVERAGAGTVEVTVGEDVVTVEQVVVAIGMTPNTGDLGLESLGIDPGDLRTDERCRVLGADRVWAVGDVTDVAPFTHTANYQGRIAADAITGGDATADYRAIPRAVFTSPEVAAVGMTREQARSEGLDVASAAFDLAGTARAAVDPAAAGHVVLVADRSDRTLVGATVVGPSAAESISEFSLAITARTPVDALTGLVHPFPTWAEGFGPALDDLRDALAS